MENKVKEFVKTKVKRKNWRVKPREKKEHFMFKPTPQYLACLDPNTFALVKVFESIVEMEYDTNKRNLQPILHRYFRNKHGKNGTPTICNMIIVRFKKEEMEDTTLEAFNQMLINRALDKIVFIQTERIRKNIGSFTNEEKEKLYKLLKIVESPVSKAEDYEL